MSDKNILVIDDDEGYLELLKECLEVNFIVFTASSISAADALVEQHTQFDLALVDECIGRDIGSEWIQRHSNKGTGATTFVLYSGLATEEAILKGLECGADDFLTKPISLFTLSQKLSNLITYHEKINHFEDELTSKDRVINVSMAQASKYGACMQLTSRLNKCMTYEKIRDEVFHFFQLMDLHGSIAFYPMDHEPIYYNAQTGCCSSAETSVIGLLRTKPRLFSFGTRTIFNHPLVSILVLNLEEGSVDTDIYVDALASVIECAGARVAFIMYKQSLTNMQVQISNVVVKTKKMLEISKHHQQEVMNEIVQNIGMSFHVLDLNEEQENYLTNLVHTALIKHTQDDINFMEIVGLLDQSLAEVTQLNALEQNFESIEEENFDEDELF